MTRQIGITMGCPAGIGPEILIKFLSGSGRPHRIMPLIIGDRKILECTAASLGADLRFRDWQSGTPIDHDVINVLAPLPLASIPEPGKPTRETGRAMGRYIVAAVELIRSGFLSAMVTCPISKSALQSGGFIFPGHTEMLADLCGGKEYAMMMVGERLRVSLVTIHLPIRDVPSQITRDRILRSISITGTSLVRDFAIDSPRIAVAALNPHGGEGGIMGGAEEEEIALGMTAAREEGWQVSGPYPADSLFYRAAAGDFDAVVAMYHDQGLIPFKLLHFHDGVNVTVGLPIIRTSVDHGTAYDIAGKGIANPASLCSAFALAEKIAANHEQREH
jgi:4-hydroxythreonine-4-phosphate dehydrogenase